jgi:hypothetical protein
MPKSIMRICSVQDCTTAVGSHGARGWCPTHYKRWRKNGDPTKLRFIHDGASDHERLMWYAKTNPDNQCWEWQGSRDHSGYGRVSGTRTPRISSRVAYETWVGPIPDGHHVCHTCDNPPCINPDHLFVGLPKDNTHDMIDKQRGLHGERHHWHRLTDEQVHAIRYLSDQGIQQRPIAKLMGCSQAQVSNIVRGAQRKHDTNWKPSQPLVAWVSINSPKRLRSAPTQQQRVA